MNNRTKVYFSAILALVLFVAPVPASRASEVDFSCVNHNVWSKDHLSSQFMDHDIVLTNNCPGAVFWSMCIERVDPWTNEILETHNPTGYVEADKKARVNLHMQKSKNRQQFRNRFQEFYVSFGYGIENLVPANCVASSCEARKRDLRAQVRSNEKAWESAQKSLNARIASECPDTGWDSVAREECAANIMASVRGEMSAYPVMDEDLRFQLAAIDPDNCTIWSGDLTAD